jgi:hypothetical protein
MFFDERVENKGAAAQNKTIESVEPIQNIGLEGVRAEVWV